MESATLETFMPHGMCYLWRPDVLALHVGSDLLIALAYFSIPAALLTFLRRRPDVEFRFIFVLFTSFILACGVTHVLSIVTTWYPIYVLEGMAKLVTALVSVATALALWPLIPKAAAIPSPEILEERNREIVGLNQDLRRQLEAMDTLSGGVAHDFNNLLTVILGNAEFLEGDDISHEERQECARSIRATSERAADLCRKMLAYSGQGHFLMVRQDLDTIVRDAGADARLELDGDLPPINASSYQLRDLVDELVENAREAGSEPQDIRIRTRMETLDAATLARSNVPSDLQPGPAVVLEVSDRGSGMTDEVLQRMCEPFFTTNDTGRGLGLAAAYGIARGHGAAMLVDSTPGEGSRFRLAFPIPDVAEEAPSAEPMPAPA